MNDRRRMPPPMMGVDVLSMELFRTVHALGRAFHEATNMHGITRTHGMVLNQLMERPAGTTAAILSRCLGITRATMSAALADMEREGLIARVPNPEDARSQLILLTETGQSRLRAFPEIVKQLDARVFAGFSDEDRRSFKELMERIRLNLGDDETEDFIGEAGVDADPSKETTGIG